MSSEPAPHQLIASDVTPGRNVQIPAFVNLHGCEIFPIAGNLDEEFLSLPMLPELTKSKSKYAARCVGEVVGAGAMV
jgi:dTDP-4-amino-4,6-dideoxygalactose transaminase